MLCVKEAIKVARPHSCGRPSINTHPGFSGRKANQHFHGKYLPPKLSKPESSRVTKSFDGEVLTSSSVIQKMKQKANM